MAAAINLLTSSSGANPSVLVQPRKLSDRLVNVAASGSSGSSSFIKNKKKTQQICCRFARPYRNSYSYRAGGVAGNLEATATTGAPASVPVRVAYELLQAGHRYLDVRTLEEFNAGHVPGAVNIPYMFRVGSGMAKNPNFLDQVSSEFRKDDEILIGCQSGKRSLMAVNDLQSAGYTGIIDIAGGYGAWSQGELPLTT